MFGRPIRIGRLFGIDITVSLTTFLVVGLIAYNFADGAENLARGLITGLIYAVLLFASILAHELGHSLVAQRLGVKIAEIELHFFGGAAKMLSMPKRPRDEILISAAGPAVSFVISGLSVVIAIPLFMVTAGIGAAASDIFVHLAYMNGILGLFNLLPALPLDGGRIFRAALSPRLGGLKATRIAVWVSRAIAVGLALAGIFLWHNYFLAAVALLIWLMGTRELRLAEMMYGRRQELEVYDQYGRPVGAPPSAPGTSADGLPRPEPRYAWTEAPLNARPEMYPGKVTMVRGPDGRIWVITQQ